MNDALVNNDSVYGQRKWSSAIRLTFYYTTARALLQASVPAVRLESETHVALAHHIRRIAPSYIDTIAKSVIAAVNDPKIQSTSHATITAQV